MNELFNDVLTLIMVCITGGFLGYYTAYFFTKAYEQGIYNELKGWETI